MEYNGSTITGTGFRTLIRHRFTFSTNDVLFPRHSLPNIPTMPAATGNWSQWIKQRDSDENILVKETMREAMNPQIGCAAKFIEHV
jgi:hypothetical protein